MKNLIRFLNRRGDVRLWQTGIRLEVEGYMPLTVEHLGHNRYYHPTAALLSVAHYGVQEGDLMRDPEIVFACTFDAVGLVALHPCYYRNDYLGIETQGYFEQDGRTMIRPRLIADWKHFSAQWDRNLSEQGFFAGGPR